MHFVSDNSEGDKDCTKELVGQITQKKLSLNGQEELEDKLTRIFS